MGRELMIGDTTLQPGQVHEVKLRLSESAVHAPVYLPVTVISGVEEGPTVFVTAAVHGNELNGVEIVRQLIFDLDHQKLSGTLICVPVVNVFGFLNRSRYFPDGRDLNRNFPGRKRGSLTARVACTVFEGVIRHCNYGIDLHTAGAGRSNVPHVRADMDHEEVRRIAKAFGTRIIKHSPGHPRSLRRVATEAGIPTVVFEAGETGRFERRVAREGVRGVLNVLYELGMVAGTKTEPPFQVIVRESQWIRADHGGIFELTVKPGALIYEGEEIGVNTNPFGREIKTIQSPLTGLVIGVMTTPMVNPGSPICHIVKLEKTLPTVERALAKNNHR